MKKTLLSLLLMTQVIFGIEYEGEVRKFIVNDEFTCPSTGLKFKTPDLNSQKLQVAYRETTPGISWQLMYASQMGHTAAITFTKIRPEYPKNDEVLERTASNMKMEAMREGGYLEWCGFLSQEKGKVLQAVVRYPRAGQTVSIRNKWLNSMESVPTDIYNIRHYLIRDGYFSEFRVYIPQLAPSSIVSEDKYIDPWFKNLHSFVTGSNLIKDNDNYISQTQEFKKPKSYFRFVFQDPSQR